MDRLTTVHHIERSSLYQNELLKMTSFTLPQKRLHGCVGRVLPILNTDVLNTDVEDELNSSGFVRDEHCGEPSQLASIYHLS